MKKYFAYGLFLHMGFFCLFLYSQDSAVCLVRAARTAQDVRIDGYLNEPDWQNTPLVDRFVQREPEEGRPATEPTQLRILYDEKYLFFGVSCFDSEPGKIVANEMRRDGELENDDYFGILIDTYHDHRNAFYFVTNPLGAKRDALIRDEGSNLNWDWDGIWRVRTRITEEGWTAEIAIPFQTLRFGSSDEQVWGLNLGRLVARKREETYWSPIQRDLGFFGKYRVSACGHLEGLRDLKEGNRIQVMPSLIGGGSKEDKDSSFKVDGDIGLDLKIRVTSNITADVTFNTDFAQVEADQEQFNLTRFNLFFPEKRSFFLEGADIFRVGERFNPFEPPSTILFFSRTIGLSDDGKAVPLKAGVRVTGKTGSTTIGLMEILTGRLSYVNDDDERVNVLRTNFSVFRIKRDIFQKSSLGAMFLSKDSLDSSDYNRTGVVDFNLAFGPSLKIDGFAAKTFDPDSRGKDLAAKLEMSWESDLLSLGFNYTDIGENFNAEMGFIARTDMRRYRLNAGIGPRPRFLNLRQSFFVNDFTTIQNHSGQLESRVNMLGNFSIFRDGSILFLGWMTNYEFLSESFEIRENVFIPEGIHRFNSFTGFYESDRSRKISFHAETNIGRFYNGSLFRINLSGALKINSHLNMEFILDRNRFDLPVSGGNFTTHIAASRIVYSLTPDLFAKAYVQYNDDEDLFKVNFLIRWIYKPGANLYLIYNETREVGTRGFIQDRALMMKMGFLF